MNAIRIKAHIDSETLRLPELKPLIGKDVEIIVLEEVRGAEPPRKTPAKTARKKQPKTGWFTRNFGSGRDMDFDGFDEDREKRRQEGLRTRDDRLK